MYLLFSANTRLYLYAVGPPRQGSAEDRIRAPVFLLQFFTKNVNPVVARDFRHRLPLPVRIYSHFLFALSRQNADKDKDFQTHLAPSRSHFVSLR